MTCPQSQPGLGPLKDSFQRDGSKYGYLVASSYELDKDPVQGVQLATQAHLSRQAFWVRCQL